jgi:hypothetical protein
MNQKSRKHKMILGITGLFGILSLFPLYVFCGQFAEQFVYDLFHENKPVRTYVEAKQLLQSYPLISYNDIPHRIRKQMHSKEIDYSRKLGALRFYVIPRKGIYKKIFLQHRISSFISGEQTRRGRWFSRSAFYYICIDDGLLKTAFDLEAALRKRGYNSAAFHIISAYRSPSHNDRVGGARNSMHLYGKAFDLRVGDINRSGRADQRDKKIVYSILDRELIRDEGGLGLYPRTMVLHMDVRGRGDRWDHYSR